jgi:hypothetical protein
MRALFSWTHFDTKHGWQATSLPSIDGLATTELLGPEQLVCAPFTEALPSWSAETPPGSWIEVQLRVRRAGRWTHFYRIALWDSQPHDSKRRSFAGQHDEDGRVATDTLVLGSPGDAVQPRVLLYAPEERPALRALRIALSGPGARPQYPPAFTPRELPVPPRSQMSYPNGEIICSPTSVSMLLAYWHARTGDARLAPFAERSAVLELVRQVYDPVFQGHGNWSFNTACASGYGLDAYVARLNGLAQIEPWLAAGVPVVISAAWSDGELANAPIPASNGHLLVVVGFDAHGRVIVADPRAESEGAVRRLYDPTQLEAAWQGKSAGTVYLIHPHGWATPPVPACC